METNKDKPIIPEGNIAPMIPLEEPNMFDAPKNFKTKWNEVDKLCPTCSQVTERSIGITKQNVKRLIIGKPTFYDWAFFFIIVMTLFSVWAYKSDTEQCMKCINDNINQSNQLILMMKQNYTYAPEKDLERNPFLLMINNNTPVSNGT